VSLMIVGLIIGITAGFMIYISADELIPTSSKKMTNQVTIISFVIGVLFVVLLNAFVG
jgi:zinc transporter ZupT